MKTVLRIGILLLLVSIVRLPVGAVESKFRKTQTETSVSRDEAKPDKKEQRRLKRVERWQERLQVAADDARGLADDQSFILGLLLIGGAIVLAILGGLGILRGLLSLIGGLAALVGLALVIIALWNYYS